MKTMTPKEKAWQLWNYYGTLFGRYDKAAEASIKVVDEMHNFMRTDDDESDTCYWANHRMMMKAILAIGLITECQSFGMMFKLNYVSCHKILKTSQIVPYKTQTYETIFSVCR